MRKRNLLAVLLVAAMVLSLAACGNGTADPTEAPTATTAPTAAPTVAPTATTAPEPTADPTVRNAASVDFEDGNVGFAAIYMLPANADDCEVYLDQFNGSQALAVKNANGKVPYITFSLAALLGEKATDVASIEMTLGTSYDDGTFNATSGQIIIWAGADLVEYTTDWSVYMSTKNPKVAVVNLGDTAFSTDNNVFMVTLKTDNGRDNGHGSAVLYIDDICFFDAAGNLLTADTTAAFAEPAGFENTGKDMTNLYAVTNAVEFDGFACEGTGWGQNGFEMPQEFIDALVPGSVIEIAYASEDGSMWIVMPWATAGWIRVAQGTAYINDSMSIAQITYEQIAALCGDDVTTWGALLQCESQSNWEVYSIKVGTAVPNYSISNAVEFAGFSCEGTAWGQNGFEMPQEVIDALVPGTAVEVSYASADGSMWIVMPDASVGWSRIQQQTAPCIDGKCYITYEQIEAVCGEDKSSWGARIQCEAASDWEVYAVNVGTLNATPAANKKTEFEGFTCEGTGWGQNGFDMTQEVLDALVPGSVVKIAYTSEDGSMWIVMPDAAAGWSRVQQQTATCVDGNCYITYEEIAAVCGDDISNWGARIQCEAASNWEVFSVTILGVQ